MHRLGVNWMAHRCELDGPSVSFVYRLGGRGLALGLLPWRHFGPRWARGLAFGLPPWRHFLDL